jgi:heat shock protein HtpX
MTIYSQISGNRNKTWLIIGLFVLVFSGFFYIIGLYYGSPTPYLILGLIISLFSSVGSYFFSDKLVLATVQAKPATKEEYFDFYTVTENLCIAAGIPMPKLYVIEDGALNAFATGRDPKHAVVCATTGILQKLNRAEIEGVIGHELSHVRNYDILVSTIVAVLVGTIALVADWILRMMWWGGDDRENRNRNPIVFVLLIIALILTPIVATLIQLAVSRKREYLADASGALLTRNPDALASALEKIKYDTDPLEAATTNTAHLFFSNPFKKGSSRSWVAGLFSTHPPIDERIKILRSM